MRSQPLIGFSVLVLSVWLACEVRGKNAVGDLNSIAFIGLGLIVCAVAITILRKLLAPDSTHF